MSDTLPYLIEDPRGPVFGKTYGLVSRDGAILVEPTAEEIRYFFEGLASIKRGGLWGVIDAHGREVIPPRYQSLDVFSDGLCRAERRGRTLFVDREGNEHDVPRSKYVDLFSDGLCAVANDKVKWGFVDRAGALVIAHTFDEVARVMEPDGIAYIDTRGERVWPR